MKIPPVTYIETDSGAYNFKASFNYKQPSALDTEGTSLCPHENILSLVQIANETDIYVLDALRISKGVLRNVMQQYSDESTCIFAQNFSYDLKVFWKYGIDFGRALVHDTMNMAKLLDGVSSLSYSLLNLCERELGIRISKEEQQSDWLQRPLSTKQVDYAAKDPYYTYLLGKKLLESILADNFRVVEKLERLVLPAISSMEYHGVTIDADILAQLEPAYEKKREEQLSEFLEYVDRYELRNIYGDVVDPGFNLGSSTQVTEFLRSRKVANPQKLYSNKKDIDPLITTSSAKELKLLSLADYPFLEPLLGYRKLQKLLTGYIYSLPGMINPITGRVHTSYTQMVSTGRLSSSTPNLQNLARATEGQITVRNAFVASPGCKLILNDYSQIELRIIAEKLLEYGDPTMLNEFLEGKDPYANTAALLSGLTYEQFVELPKADYKTRRQQAKAVRLGYNYCLTGCTQVITLDGVKRLQDITTEDKVLTHTGQYQNVVDTQKTYTDTLIEVVTSTGKRLRMTPDHHMLGSTDSDTSLYWVAASHMKLSDNLITVEKNIESIVTIKYHTVENYPVYDITVDNDHSFVANGLISHNCMGAPSFRNYAHANYGVNMTQAEAYANRERYFSLYPGLTKYHEEMSERSLREAYTFAPFKRMRRWDSYPGVSALSNHPIQGTGGDILKLALAYMYIALDDAGYSPTQSTDVKLLLNIHDEVNLECIEDKAEYTADLSRRCMVKAGEFVLKSVPIDAEPLIVDNLAQKT